MIKVIIYDEIKKNDLDEFKNLCLEKHYLRHLKKNIYIYDIAFNDFRKESTIINNIKKDLKNNGYINFDII